MFKAQLKFQKIISFVALIASVLVFIYSLGLVTDLFDMLYYATYDIDGEYFSDIDGALIYYDIQPFNNALLVCSLVLIAASLTLFITGCQKRRLYHVGNYVATGLVAVSNIAVAIWGMVQVGKFRAQFLKVDFEAVKAYADFWKTLYTESTFWFDIGYVVFALLIVMSLVVVGNLIWKILITKREKELLRGSVNKEVTA